MKCYGLLFILLFFMPENIFGTHRCSRYPSNTFTPKSPVDENFVISITSNAQTYILGQSYNVSLQAFNGHRFISAKLVLENENGEKGFNGDLGHLEVTDPVETRYSEQCINMVESTTTTPKTRLDMVWIAPTEPGNGCVLIRATVLQHRDVWFMDDGGLTKRVCEEVVDDLESQKKDAEEQTCCACDEARYEITFEGFWSRNLHPKDFPAPGWLTRFSDILGAAHTSDYRFWDKGELASPEMQEFAEHGSSKGLEREFNQYFKEGKIRTIIKARGPTFPYMNSASLASVRVDPLHHQISLASKIMPSPDWIVGITGLELCFTNCTWLEEKVINLYPWDIGTDAGPSYASPDQPQFPADVIRRMSSEYPPDPRSPFFDEAGVPMKPMATLTIKRQRLYERKCEDDESNNAEDMPRECFTHPWSAWSECTAECGIGRQYSTRVFKQPDLAKLYNCDSMVEKRRERPCQGQKCSQTQTADFAYPNNQWSKTDNEEKEMFEADFPQLPVKAMAGFKSRAECEVSKWSPWSACNVTCGEGVMERVKVYINPYNERECQEVYHVKLREYRKCQGNNCLGYIPDALNNNEDYSEESQDLAKTNRLVRPLHHMLRSKELPDKQFNNVDPNEEAVELVKPAYDFQAEDLKQELPIVRPFYQRTNKYHNNIQASSAPSLIQLPPNYCYQPLNIVQDCIEPRVVGNFWFYNYCADECMLFAADICDNNRNKFLSLERCEEHCAMPMRNLPRFLKQQQTQGCREGQFVKRNFKKRRDYD